MILLYYPFVISVKILNVIIGGIFFRKEPRARVNNVPRSSLALLEECENPCINLAHSRSHNFARFCH